MKAMPFILGIFGALAFSLAAASELPETWDGLVEVKPKRMGAAYVLPGADFRAYTKVIIDPTEAAFRKDWLEDANRSSTTTRKITEEDAAEILAAARSNFDDVFKEAFVKAGYPVAEAPGPDVLRISTAVVNLAVNAPMPDQGVGRSMILVADAGEATLILEVRDSLTGALMGRVLDRREARHGAGGVSSASNKSDFRALFGQWAKIAVKGLDELKAHSPVPEDIKPKDKI
jgi:hypothetical protein